MCACEAPIVAADVAPVREVLRAGSEEPFFFGFFDIRRLVDLTLARLADKDAPRPFQSRMERFDQALAVPAYERLIVPGRRLSR